MPTDLKILTLAFRPLSDESQEEGVEDPADVDIDEDEEDDADDKDDDDDDATPDAM